MYKRPRKNKTASCSQKDLAIKGRKVILINIINTARDVLADIIVPDKENK